MSDDDRSDFPTPPAHFLATSADATDASAAAGPGPSTAQHRAAAFLAAGADQPPLKKRGGSKDKERALTGGLEGEGASPPAKRSRKGAGPRRGRASSRGKAARAALGDDDDNEDDGDGSAYRSGSGDNDEDEDEDEDEDGDSDSDATSRSSSSRGGTPSTSRRRGRSVKSAAAVLDRGGIKLKASLRCHVPPPVPRLFRSEDLDALLAKVADVDGEGIEGLRDELRDALQSAMDPCALLVPPRWSPPALP